MNIQFKNWMCKPENITKCFLMVLPLIASQILQRLYPIIDNRYLTVLGHEALYVHNIQYNFINFGQFIGLATFISCLVFWKRKECLNQQGSILIKHLFLAGLFTVSLGLLGWVFTADVLTSYKIEKAYFPLAIIYLKIGLCNMVLQAIYGGLDGMLVGTQQQKCSMYISTFLVMGNILVDHYAVYSLYSGASTTGTFYFPMIVIALSTTFLLIVAVILALFLVVKRVQGWETFPLKQMLPVWWGELGSYLIRGIVPFIYTYQLCFVDASSSFLVTYQLALHLSYVFCFPLISAMQIAVRDSGSTANAYVTSEINVPGWWRAFLYTGLIPTTMFLISGVVASVSIMQMLYGYITPVDHVNFLALFFLGCWIGQWGNAFTVPLRVAKKSYLVTKNFFVAELVVMLGGTQLLIYLHMATPEALGYVTLMFTSAYCVLNLSDAYRLNMKRKMAFVYEKVS